MIPGTSKILLKSGPVYLLAITKMLQNIQENDGIILEKYYLCQYGTQKVENVRGNVGPRYHVLRFCFLRMFHVFFVKVEYMSLNILWG